MESLLFLPLPVSSTYVSEFSIDSPQYHPQRGIRQGCPLRICGRHSPNLSYTVETLSCFLHLLQHLQPPHRLILHLFRHLLTPFMRISLGFFITPTSSSVPDVKNSDVHNPSLRSNPSTPVSEKTRPAEVRETHAVEGRSTKTGRGNKLEPLWEEKISWEGKS